MIPRAGYNIESIEKEEQINAISIFLKDTYSILNHGIIPVDNFRGALLNVTFTALNTNTTVTHGLAFPPQNYFVVGLSADMRIYDGTTLSTNTNLTLKCAGSTGVARIFAF